ncbi:MAG: prenyltransferase [Anaerolineae bacterium]
MFKLWVRILRAPFFTATVAPVFLGTAIAWRDGYFHLGYFLLTFIGALCAHAATNIANDYFDHLSGNDELNLNPTPFSGGSRVIQEKIVPPWQMITLAGAFYIITAAIGIYLAWMRGWDLLYIGLAGMLASLLYNPWLAYVGHGFGEISVGLGFGPIMLAGAYFVQAQKITPAALWASLPLAFLIALVLYVNEFPDYEADKAARKKTTIVVVGRKRAVPGYIAILAAAYLSTLAGVLAGLLPYTSLLVLLTLPLAWKAAQGVLRFYDQTPALLPSNALTIQIHLLIGLLLTLAYMLDKIFLV